MSYDLIQIFNSVIVSVGVLTALFLAFRWMRMQERARYEDRYLREKTLQLQHAEKPSSTTNASDVGAQSGGYIVLNLPEDQKALFHDVLKGFEEYASLKGYVIKFSIDNSIQDKIAFKFTIGQSGITVSTQRVEQDLHEYIVKVQQGDPLDDLPIVIPEPHHHALVMAMRNRINFLHHTYIAQKNVLAFYEEIMRNTKSGAMGIVPANNFYLQGSGTMTPNQYTAIDSQNVAQGQGNNSSHNVIDQSVRVGNSFNERKDQIDALERLINSLESSEHFSSEPAKRAVLNLEKVKDELSHEDRPDASRMKKWLETAKETIGTLGLTKEVVDVAKEVFSAFGLGA